MKTTANITSKEIAANVERVRDLLPDVVVQIAGKRVTCRTYGRKESFCSIALPDGGSVEYSWETITRHHLTNSESALRL